MLGVFSSCGHKTVDPIDDQTSSSPSEDTNTTSATEEIHQSENTGADEKLTTNTEDVDFVIVGGENVTVLEYNYTIEKVGDQWYMVLNDILPAAIYTLP